MFRHYFTSALNSYRRAPFTTCVNVLALSLGLACFICAYALTKYYEAGDRGFANSNRIYALTQRLAMRDGPDTGAIPTTSLPPAKYLRVDFPQIEKIARATARAFNDMPVVSGKHKGFLHVTGFMAMQIYLDLFSNRIDLTLVPFVLSLLVTLLIAWIAVSGQAWRAARVQPARTLRYE